ncbi:MAG: virulence factor BrkB family protein [Sedimenticola sp.]|nr:virulence factor BrkB family protein [Sedimenticola sp.]
MIRNEEAGSADRGPLGRIHRFVRLLLSRIDADLLLPSAAALTFTTLLALVPLMTVVLAIFSAFPVSDRIVEQLQGFVFSNFLPASGEVISSYLNRFSENASRMTGPGLLFLVVVALLLMANIERAFNRIWRVKQRRRPLSRFLVYWAILTLGPLLIGISVAVTSYLVSMPQLSGAASWLGESLPLLKLMPVVASAFAFSLLYLVVPNRQVPLRHAVFSGVLAALMFELSKRLFAYYITQFPTYEAIYGALAAMPIFLLWLYLAWGITLLGAEVCSCLGLSGQQAVSAEGKRLLLDFSLLRELYQVRETGRGLTTNQLARALNADPGMLINVLGHLRDAHLVALTESGEWLAARDFSNITLAMIYQAEKPPLPDPGPLMSSENASERALGRHLQYTGERLAESLSVPLEQLFQIPEESVPGEDS